MVILSQHEWSKNIAGIFLLVLLFTVACNVQSSEEGILAFSNFRLESGGLGSSDKVIVEGVQNTKGQIVSLNVSAFGKDYIVPKERLADLDGLSANGVRISYEAGYAELGGRTIYIQFQMGFVSHTVHQVLVTLTEDGKVKVNKVKTGEVRP